MQLLIFVHGLHSNVLLRMCPINWNLAFCCCKPHVWSNDVCLRIGLSSLALTFECWNIRSQDYSFLGTFVPMMELSFLGPFVPGTVRSKFPRTNKPCRPFPPRSRRCWSTLRQHGSTAGCGPPRRCRCTDLRYVRTTTLRGGTTRWTVAVVGEIWTCISWPRFCSRFPTSASRLHWCPRHVCAGTSGRPISACKAGWRQCGRLTRPHRSALLRKCSARADICSGVARHFPATRTHDVWRPNNGDWQSDYDHLYFTNNGSTKSTKQPK